MADTDLEAGLRSLRESLRQIKSLLAWEELKRLEQRPHQLPAFTPYEPTETDLRNEYSFFLSTLLQIHSILNECSLNISQEKRESIKRQLARIEQEIHALGLHQRFSIH